MLGLVNRSFELFVRDNYGKTVWERLARQAKVDPRGFFLLQQSSEAVTKTMISEASRILKKSADELVEDLGGWLTRREPIRRLLRFGGRDYPEFIELLSELSDRAVMVIDSLNTPKVRVTAHSANLYEVEITGDSDIWVVLLAGILRGMADDYGALVVIAIEGRVLRIDIALSEYGVMRPFALIAENTNQVQT